jgi:23S rRNA (guanine745-N1)-methyltransferase
MQFHCPLDGKILTATDNALKCESGHSFDRAKEGYFNLLLVQQKASLDPGDNKEMVEARRRFLATGHFAPIAKKLAEFGKAFSTSHAPRFLDAGCGEGYYLGQLREAMPRAELAGIDISKWAVKAAAKGHKGVAWAVASSKQLPFDKKFFDAVICLFGFPFWESFKSVLADGGHILLVDPAPEHLWELREVVYDQVNKTDLSRIEGALEAGFTLVKEETLNFRVTLEQNSAIQDLLAMTPHGYRITVDARDRLAKLDRLETRVSVVFRLLKAPLA